jgi:hypothetical protein
VTAVTLAEMRGTAQHQLAIERIAQRLGVVGNGEGAVDLEEVLGPEGKQDDRRQWRRQQQERVDSGGETMVRPLPPSDLSARVNAFIPVPRGANPTGPRYGRLQPMPRRRKRLRVGVQSASIA